MELSEEDFNKIFEVFKVECDEHIQNLNTGLLALEEDPDQAGLTEEIFREAHSLKGAARMLNFTSIEKIAHHMETILGKVKKNELSLSHEVTGLILKGLDSIELIVNQISQGETEDDIDTSSLVNLLLQVAEGNVPEKEIISFVEASKPTDSSDMKSVPVKEELKNNRDINLFLQETGEAYQELVNSLLSIEKNPDNKKEQKSAYEQAHALKGCARIVNHKEMGDISFSIEHILLYVLNGKIPATSRLITTLLEGVDFIKSFIHQVETGEKSKVTSDFSRVISAIDAMVATQTAQPQKEKEASKKSKSSSAGKVSGKNDQLISPAPKTAVSTKPQKALVLKAKSTVRISSDKLDRLMEQAGELLVMKLKSHQRLKEAQSIIDYCEGVVRSLKKKMRQRNRAKLPKEITVSNDTAVSGLAPFSENLDKFINLSDRIESFHKAFYDDYRQLSIIIDKLQESVKKTRLFPIQSVLDLFPRMVRDISISLKKKIKLNISGGSIEIDKYMLEEIKDPLMHIIRNGIDHGLELPEERVKLGKPEEGIIQLNVFFKGNNVVIKISDDGKGIDTDRIKASAVKKGLYNEKEMNKMNERQVLDLIFHPGFSTSDIITDISGRGIGMDVVKANIVEKLKGTIDVETTKGKGSVFIVMIPLALSTTQALKVSVGGEIFFLSVNMVEKIIKVSENTLPDVEGYPAIRYYGSFIPYVKLSSILEIQELASENNSDNERPAIVLRSGKSFAAFGIDKFIGEEEILVKGLGGFMKRVRNVSGVTIMRDGKIAPILNVPDMIKMVHLRGIDLPKKGTGKTEAIRTLSILVVDDSMMTRTLQRNILESYGYNVIAAVDGKDAFTKLMENEFDLIVSDIQMPNMDGLELTEKIKQDKRYEKIPVILVTALESTEDKKRGIEVGADAYIIKSSFDQSNLLDTIKRLT